MFKKVLGRCLIGAAIGVVISLVITMVISLIIGGGSFYAVAPELAEAFNSEIAAVWFQFGLSLLYGAAWGGASLVWEQEWSILKQTLVHLAVCSVFTLPIAYFARWMPHSAGGILAYFGIFFAVYASIWFSQYMAAKKRVQEMNDRLNEK